MARRVHSKTNSTSTLDHTTVKWETWVSEVTTVDLDDHKVTFQLDKNTTKTMILTEDGSRFIY